MEHHNPPERDKNHTMANPEELRKRDQELPKRKRKYPQSRVTQALVVLLVIVVIAWLVSLI
ncbi:Hypothetical protein [Corynebacterium glutamicum ATCC 13032]|uniref:Uncharacterized protein n=3 Tax=Corynebacterium TaxID=1716 RepID=Q8NNA5_CORGL|nr:Hypothetical protein [Corynebacterium glutamicum ATCC 13032]